jgi:regulator of sigma E protease
VHSVLNIVEIVIAVGLIIFIHELGHFASAKAFGVRVRKFAMGMGPVIVKWGKGETEYSLRWVPLGGFVDLVGEHPEADEADDPRGLWRRPAWQKVIVFTAGVFMNAVMALILFTLAPVVGIEVPPPVVGGVSPGMPAAKAGILPGDHILAIDGRPTDSFEDLLNDVGLSNAGTTFEMAMGRPVPGSDVLEPYTVSLTSVRGPGAPMPQVGIMFEMEPKLSRIPADSVLRSAGLKEGDRILSVNGRPVETWRALDAALDKSPPRQCSLKIRRQEEELDLAVDFSAVQKHEFGFGPSCRIAGVTPESPAAKAGLEADDRIVSVADIAWPTVKAFSDFIKGRSGTGPVRLVVDRKGKEIEVSCTPTMEPGADYPRLGVALESASEAPVRAGVDPQGAAYEAGLRAGDVILSAGEDAEPVKDGAELQVLLAEAGDKPVTLHIRRGAEEKDVEILPRLVRQDRLSLVGAMGDFRYVPLPRIVDPMAAARRGIHQTGVWFKRAYITLKQLVTGEVSAKMATGPVGIVQITYFVASHGLGTLIDFIGMLSVFIAVLNFLPIPPFDGGHVLFTLIDKALGKPVSLRVRTRIWIVGWSLVLLLFLVVTYRDIMRLIQQLFGA